MLVHGYARGTGTAEYMNSRATFNSPIFYLFDPDQNPGRNFILMAAQMRDSRAVDRESMNAAAGRTPGNAGFLHSKNRAGYTPAGIAQAIRQRIKPMEKHRWLQELSNSRPLQTASFISR
jgi:hypothetical protein